MSEYRLVLSCPYCGWTFEATPPDSWHSAYSFAEPLMNSSQGEVKKQKAQCQNAECKKPIIVYWYAPMEYFNTM